MKVLEHQFVKGAKTFYNTRMAETLRDIKAAKKKIIINSISLLLCLIIAVACADGIADIAQGYASLSLVLLVFACLSISLWAVVFGAFEIGDLKKLRAVRAESLQLCVLRQIVTHIHERGNWEDAQEFLSSFFNKSLQPTLNEDEEKWVRDGLVKKYPQYLIDT